MAVFLSQCLTVSIKAWYRITLPRLFIGGYPTSFHYSCDMGQMKNILTNFLSLILIQGFFLLHSDSSLFSVWPQVGTVTAIQCLSKRLGCSCFFHLCWKNFTSIPLFLLCIVGVDTVTPCGGHCSWKPGASCLGNSVLGQRLRWAGPHPLHSPREGELFFFFFFQCEKTCCILFHKLCSHSFVGYC